MSENRVTRRIQPRARGVFLSQFLLILTSVSACQSVVAPRPLFRPALDAHLTAVTSRNLESFEATITSGNELYVIFPNGKALTTTSKVVDFHRDWFLDDNWVMEPEVVKIIEGEDMATAVLKYRYRDSPLENARMSWLVLVFRLEGSEWRLVHDQNTRIED